MKQTVTAYYDRIAFFADTNSFGLWFVCLLEKHQESAQFFGIMKKHVASVGYMYILLELDHVNSYISRTLVCAMYKNCIIPLVHNPELLPNIELNSSKAAKMRYFSKKHQIIKFSRARTCSHKVSCNGTSCNCQKCSDVKKVLLFPEGKDPSFHLRNGHHNWFE